MTLDDQFLPPTMLSVDEPELFCPPASKNGLEIEEPEEHLTTYGAPSPLEPDLGVRTEDQFGLRTLRVIGARELFVPTQKLVGDLGFPDRLNHYWRYEASGPKVGQTVTFDDQFGSDTGARRAAAPVLQQKRMPPEGTKRDRRPLDAGDETPEAATRLDAVPRDLSAEPRRAARGQAERVHEVTALGAALGRESPTNGTSGKRTRYAIAGASVEPASLAQTRVPRRGRPPPRGPCDPLRRCSDRSWTLLRCAGLSGFRRDDTGRPLRSPSDELERGTDRG